MALSIGAIARKLPTSGFAYTYTVKGFGPTGGFVSGWLLLGSYAMVAPMLLSGISALLSSFLAGFGLAIPWWVITVLFFLLALLIVSLGINRSVNTALVFLTFELAVMVALFLTIVIRGGAAGNTLAGFNPGLSPSGLSGIGIGALWRILMFVGFESAGTLGEEARAPRITVPRALITAVLAIGFVYLFSAYAGVVGFGIPHIKQFMANPAPWSALGLAFWGPAMGKLVMVAALASIFANLISGANSVIRVMYNMG
jgi:amino acid transporter